MKIDEGATPGDAELSDLTDPVQELQQRVIQRPDGWHWVAPDGRQEFGPYASVEEALAAMAEANDETPEPGESLEEAESELGVCDWVDPETGALAEQARARIVDR